MPIQKYITEIEKKWQSNGDAREHTYRPALENLLKAIMPDLTALNDPARIHVGSLDFILRRGEIDVGYIETKDLNVNLNQVEKSEQLKRYLDLDNLILTDYLEFRFYRDGEKIDSVRIGDALMDKVEPRHENFAKLKALLEDFAAHQGQTIKSAEKLAEMMARKARLMREVFREVLTRPEPSTLKDQCDAFKKILMHDLDEKQFADIYAQTITYGLFTARLHDRTLENFSREEAQHLIPRSNPFMRQLFHYVTGPDLDSRVIWIVNDLCNVFLAANIKDIVEKYFAGTRRADPILHFYETFLGAYDPALRKARGVWYTPEPVVKFIVRAIDDVLKDHFGLKDGIADTSKVDIDVETDVVKGGKRVKEKQSVHKVQLLDVATGTGTFLAEAIRQIYAKMDGVQGMWSGYVERDLLPRLHGFELLMASYAMCHMKLDLILSDMGYKPTNPQDPPRVSVFLTNSLEEYHPDAGTLFSFIAKEANEASRIKRDKPIMVAFGNPPYSGHSSNNGEWIQELIEAYKREPAGGKLQEKNSKWLNDDYVKFIRLGEHYIEKNGEGVLAYITNHSYLDNPTFRGMRWKLMNTFDDIYILDLHGNAKKKEVTPDGSKDANVFDIQQGVAIIVAVKKSSQNSPLSLQGEGRGEGDKKGKGKKKSIATVHHMDIWGTRQEKYDFLNEKNLSKIKWKKLSPQAPLCLFTPINEVLHDEYKNYFSTSDLFIVNGTGMTTARDDFVISEDRELLIKNAKNFQSSTATNTELCHQLSISEKKGWDINRARKLIKEEADLQKFIQNITYRPFDNRKIFYHDSLIWRTVRQVMENFIKGENYGLVTARSNKSGRPDHFFISKFMTEAKTGESSTQSCLMPLYRYEPTMGAVEQRVPNLDPKIYAVIKKTVADVSPENLFDYIYAVLHAPAYRERYAEFLKSDFPRIPYPANAKTFHALAAKGGELRALHLLESPLLDKTGVTYPVSGDNVVEKPRFDAGRVYINAEQYFDGISNTAWDFYIGGYQPAQKWLKDRKGRTLTLDDITHYRRVIKSLTETTRIMAEINAITFLPE